MGSDLDVLRCLLNVKFPLHHPFAAPHHMAASNGSTHWCVYINNQKKSPLMLPQIIPNLKYIPQNCSKNLFIHLFN